MAWIRLEDTIGEHPKTLRLAALLEVHPVEAVGHLAYLFTWVIRFRPSGYLGGLSADEIARAGRWAGKPEKFLEGLHEAGWLDLGPEKENLSVHNWKKFTSGYLKAKADAERRRAKLLQRGEPPQDSGVAEPDSTDFRRALAAAFGPQEQNLSAAKEEVIRQALRFHAKRLKIPSLEPTLRKHLEAWLTRYDPKEVLEKFMGEELAGLDVNKIGEWHFPPKVDSPF